MYKNIIQNLPCLTYFHLVLHIRQCNFSAGGSAIALLTILAMIRRLDVDLVRATASSRPCTRSVGSYVRPQANERRGVCWRLEIVNTLSVQTEQARLRRFSSVSRARFVARVLLG
mgnify:CR=1 FL=1